MANRRMLSKSISTSQKVSKISLLAKLIYTWMIPNCDDYGQMAGDADSIRWEVIPRIGVSLEEVEKCLQEMEEIKLIRRFLINDKQYLRVENFDNFQTFKNDRPKNDITNGKSGIQRNPVESQVSRVSKVNKESSGKKN